MTDSIYNSLLQVLSIPLVQDSNIIKRLDCIDF